MKVKLREVNLIFHVPVPGPTRNWLQVIVQVGLLNGALDVTFCLPGDESREMIPAAVIEGIQEAVAWARKNVKAKDLHELDPEERDEE